MRATVSENGESPYAVTISVSGHTLKGDEPKSAGGNDSGPGPYDYLVAALGECTAMTVRMYAERKNWPLEEVEVFIDFRRELAEGQDIPTDIFEKHVILHGADLSDEQRKRLLEISARSPIHRSLENTPVIRTFGE